MKTVVVYGADWCSITRHARDHLEQMGIDYEYVDLDGDPKAEEWVKRQNNGKAIKPTIKVGDQVLSAPTDAELEEAVS